MSRDRVQSQLQKIKDRAETGGTNHNMHKGHSTRFASVTGIINLSDYGIQPLLQKAKTFVIRPSGLFKVSNFITYNTLLSRII